MSGVTLTKAQKDRESARRTFDQFAWNLALALKPKPAKKSKPARAALSPNPTTHEGNDE